MRVTADDRARFALKYQLNEVGCWIWQGLGRVGPYGVFKFHNMTTTTVAHRAAWILSNGPIKKGLLVLHRCDVPLCVRPEHLFLGTHLDNSRDMVAKNRQSRGESKSKLSEANVLAIRAAYAAGESPTALSRQYDLHVRSVWGILRRERWGWLQPEAH